MGIPPELLLRLVQGARLPIGGLDPNAPGLRRDNPIPLPPLVVNANGPHITEYEDDSREVFPDIAVRPDASAVRTPMQVQPTDYRDTLSADLANPPTGREFPNVGGLPVRSGGVWGGGANAGLGVGGAVANADLSALLDSQGTHPTGPHIDRHQDGSDELLVPPNLPPEVLQALLAKVPGRGGDAQRWMEEPRLNLGRGGGPPPWLEEDEGEQMRVMPDHSLRQDATRVRPPPIPNDFRDVHDDGLDEPPNIMPAFLRALLSQAMGGGQAQKWMADPNNMRPR